MNFVDYCYLLEIPKERKGSRIILSKKELKNIEDLK